MNKATSERTFPRMRRPRAERGPWSPPRMPIEWFMDETRLIFHKWLRQRCCDGCADRFAAYCRGEFTFDDVRAMMRVHDHIRVAAGA
jgi:hypothetical protein